MHDVPPACPRAGDLFPRVVRDAFAFLETHYGFGVVASGPTAVRYESAAVVVTVARGPRAGQLQFEIGRRDVGAVPHSLAEVLAAADPEPPQEPSSEEELLTHNALEIALVIRTIGQRLLRGEVAAFGALRARRGRAEPT